MVTHTDSHIVRAALWSVILAGVATADAEAVACELNPTPGQGGYSTPWDGWVLVGGGAVVCCNCRAVAGRHTGGEGTHHLPLQGGIAGETDIALRPVWVHFLAIAACGILQ